MISTVFTVLGYFYFFGNNFYVNLLLYFIVYYLYDSYKKQRILLTESVLRAPKTRTSFSTKLAFLSAFHAMDRSPSFSVSCDIARQTPIRLTAAV